MNICAIDEQDLQVISQLYVSVFNNPPGNKKTLHQYFYSQRNYQRDCKIVLLNKEL